MHRLAVGRVDPASVETTVPQNAWIADLRIMHSHHNSERPERTSSAAQENRALDAK